jgi:hypothetical protein
MTRVIIPFSTTVVLPFNINFQVNSTAINLKSNKFFRNKIFVKLKNYLLEISKDNHRNFIDTAKYHDYISNYLGPNNDVSFLETFIINSTKIKSKLKNELPLNRIINNADLSIGENELKVNGESILVNLLDPIIILNKVINLGYVVFRFSYFVERDNTVLEESFNLEVIKKLSENPFFRYFKENNDKYLVNFKQGDLNFSFNLDEINKLIFDTFYNDIDFYLKKPVLFYFGSIPFSQIPNDQFYKLLRIPPIKEDIGLNIEDRSKIIEERIKCINMDEGSIVLDYTKSQDGIKGVFNKYFPAFILALNQREVMMKVTRIISTLNSSDIERNRSRISEKLGSIRKLIHILQLKQIFYNLSNYNEISVYYKRLQESFNLERLLMDNKESIESIHGLIESENTLKDKNRDINIGLFIFVITMMEGLKVTIEIIEDKQTEHNIYKLIFGLLVVFIIIVVKWNSIITSILNIIDFDFLTKTSKKKDNNKK